MNGGPYQQDVGPRYRELLYSHVLGGTIEELSEDFSMTKRQVQVVLESPMAKEEVAKIELRIDQLLAGKSEDDPVRKTLVGCRLLAARRLKEHIQDQSPTGKSYQAAVRLLESEGDLRAQQHEVKVDQRLSISDDLGRALVATIQTVKQLTASTEGEIIDIGTLESRCVESQETG